MVPLPWYISDLYLVGPLTLIEPINKFIYHAMFMNNLIICIKY